MNTDATTYRQRQILLVVAGIVVFSEPFLGIVRSEAMVFGLPSTMVMLFGLWLAVIVGIAWIMRGDPGLNLPGSTLPPGASPASGQEQTAHSTSPANTATRPASRERAHEP